MILASSPFKEPVVVPTRRTRLPSGTTSSTPSHALLDAQKSFLGHAKLLDFYNPLSFPETLHVL